MRDTAGASATKATTIGVVEPGAGTTTRITNGNGESSEPSVSGDGRYITFSSDASTLVPADTNGHADVFVFER